MERILVIHQGALGDFICCLPALASLRRAFADTHMTFMGYPRILDLVENRYYADRVVSVDRADVAILYQESVECPAGLRDFLRAFQLIVVIGCGRSPFVQNLKRISRASVKVIEPFPSCGKTVHMVDHLLSLPRSLGLPVDDTVPRLYLSESDRDTAAVFLANHGVARDTALIAIHAGSGSRAKTWSLERFLDLADNLGAAYQTRILFVVGPGEAEIRQDILSHAAGKPSIIVDGLPLPHLAAILERCKVLIGNDSGITHMAAAVGVPVVTIFGPSDPRRWIPRGIEVHLVRRVLSCSPCDRDAMSRCEHQRCLFEISVEEVTRIVKRVMMNRDEKRSCTDWSRLGVWESQEARRA